MTYSEWDIDDATLPQSRRFKCSLGINKSTGRLQWCPGCKCVKMLVILPVTLLPILLVFLLLTHLDLVGSVHHRDLNQESAYSSSGSRNNYHQQQRNFLSISNTIDDNVDTNDENIEENGKCISIRYSMSETVDNEEKELLKDVRTSFFPSDSVFVPPNCQNQHDADGLSDNRNELIDDQTYRSFMYRRRRASNGSYNVSQENDGPSITIDLVNKDDEIEVKREQGDDTEQGVGEQFMDTGPIQAFWKDEGK